MRPQFGSPPHQLVLTNELFATARAAASASPKDLPPETRTVTMRETPSPSRTIILANSRQTWFSADWNISKPCSRRREEADWELESFESAPRQIRLLTS